MKIWKSTWATYQNRIPLPTEAQQASLDKKRLKIHSNLAKAESSLATQIRTEKIGLANFLFNRRVPNVNSPACICGWPRQTAKHAIMHCQLIDGRNELVNQVKTNNYRTIIEKADSMVNAGRYTKTVFNCSDHAVRIVPVDTAFEMFDFFPFSFVLFRFLSRTSQIHVIRYTEGSWGSRRRLFWLLGFYSLKGFPMYNSHIEPRPHGPAFGR